MIFSPRVGALSNSSKLTLACCAHIFCCWSVAVVSTIFGVTTGGSGFAFEQPIAATEIVAATANGNSLRRTSIPLLLGMVLPTVVDVLTERNKMMFESLTFHAVLEVLFGMRGH